MKIDLKGKVALVTGGTRGIGAATAIMLAESGASVSVNYHRNVKGAQAFTTKIRKRRLNIFLVPGDISDNLEADQVVHRVVERAGRLDILVNNAGIWEPNFIDHPRAEEAWDRTIKVNLKSAFNITSHAVQYLKRAKEGRIINIGSTAGQRGEANYSAYAASKGGLVAFTKSLAMELGPHHILVNCVSPGWVFTDMTVGTLKKANVRKEILKQIPLGKVGKPEDIAAAVVFLASSYAGHITGEVLNVNGGSVLDG